MSLKNSKNIILYCAVSLCLSSIFIWGYSPDVFPTENELSVWESDCEYTLENGIYTIDSICINEKRLPTMTLTEIINKSWDQIFDFSGYYKPLEESFNYYGASPIFKTKGNPYLQENENADKLISDAIKLRGKITFSETELAQYYAKHLSYSVADKDLTNLGNCTRKNYLLALESMDNYMLSPGDVLNINRKLSTIKGYCKGKIEEDHLFYGGVCGMVSQLFRVSLIHPNIAITKRFPHNEWFVQYYGENVGGDDASVYERSKQFEIKNTGESNIIFKIHDKGNQSIMVAISWPTNKWVNISKNLIDKRSLAIHLEKTVYKSEKSGDKIIDNIERVENFDSYYTKRTYEFR